MRLITSEQYLNTLAYIFGNDIKLDTDFAPMHRSDGLLEVGASSEGVTSGQLERYQRAAAAISAKIVDPAHRDFLISCHPADEKGPDKACAAEFLAKSGRLLFRRPLSDALLNEAVERADEGAGRLKDFYAGLRLALEGMLISPNMLFIVDAAEPDPTQPGRKRFDAFALASRLSFFLWNAAPDDALLKAAESGELETAKGKRRVVDMMLASPRLETGMRAFFSDMLGFDNFDNLAKDPLIYPLFTSVTAQDAREQTLRTIVDQLITKNKDYRDLFTTRETFISPSLAALYKLPSKPGWTAYEFPPGSPRVGMLAQVGFLAVHSHPGRSSPTLRGKALRELLLCQPVPSPPANVDFSAVENPKSNFHTGRDRLTAHRNNPICAGCHKIMDPIGLTLENFDGSGQFRETENGAPIDVSGSLDGKDFQDVAGLSQALHDAPALTACLVKRAYIYGMGGAMTRGDLYAMRYFDARFSAQGYRLPDLLRTIVLSTAFSEVREPPVPVQPIKTVSAQTTQDAAMSLR